MNALKYLFVAVSAIFLPLFALADMSEPKAPESKVYESVMVGNVERSWAIYVPSSYKKSKNVPMLLNFHGTGSSPEQVENIARFEAIAEREGFILVSPKAAWLNEKLDRITWNVDKRESDIDDLAYIDALLAKVFLNYSIDKSRVYASGFSGGGRMSSRLACDRADTFAAVAPVAGLRFPEDCSPKRAVPILTFHGKLDPVNHYTLREDSPPYWRMGIDTALSKWQKENGCGSQVEEKMHSNLSKIVYQPCSDKAEVVFYLSEDTGHTWPGSPAADIMKKYGMGTTEAAIAASELIWQFFEKHTLP